MNEKTMKKTQRKQEPEKRKTDVDSIRGYRVAGHEIVPIPKKKRKTNGYIFKSIGIPASHLLSIAITDNEKISNVYFCRLTKAPVCFTTHIGVEDVTYEDFRAVCSKIKVEWPETYSKKQMDRILLDGIEYMNIDVPGLRVLIPDIKEFLDGYYSRLRNMVFFFNIDGYLEEIDEGSCISAFAFDAICNDVMYEMVITSRGIELEPIIKPSCKKMLLMTLVHRNTYLSLPDEYTREQCPEIQIEGLADSSGNRVSIAPDTCLTYNGLITGDDTALIYNLQSEISRLKS